MKDWFNGLDSTTRAIILTLLITVANGVLNHFGITAPTPVTVPPAQVNVQPAPGAPLVAAPAPVQK